MLDRLPLVGRLFRRKALSSVPVGTGGWYPLIREPFAGAWQRNLEIDNTRAATYHADFACKTLIASDIAKLRVKLVAQDKDGIWNEVDNPAYSPVLRKPNRYQTRNQFWESWVLSKLSRGNTYVLKVRDNRKVVIGLHVLDPQRVTPLIASDGSVFYRLATADLAGLAADVTVPAVEIIHDRMNCLFHPLVGIPPIYAAALAATQGLNIQTQSARLFANNAAPGGILTAPGEISDETANRLKADWEKNYGGANFGRVAVLGDDLKYQAMTMTAEASQLIDQLKWTAEVVCSTYHVPTFKITGNAPTYNNVQALEQIYYNTCLQSLIEHAEACLDEGLGLGEQYALGVEFETDNLLRMDTVAQMDALEKGKNYMTPDEGRKRLNLKPVPGGNVVYRQQQDYSLAALAKRDAQADPFRTAPASPPPSAEPEDEPEPEDDDDEVKAELALLMRKSLGVPLLEGGAAA
jgi:HK97 family phage portal protein